MTAKITAKKRYSALKRFWPLYLLLLPSLIYLAVFSYWPMYGVQIAFRSYNASLGFSGSEWVGIKHFIKFITYPDFWQLIGNTLAITLYRLIASFPLPIILAIMINECRNRVFKRSVQLLTYIPHFISTVVLCGMVTLFLGREGGLFNMIRAVFG